MRTVYEARKKGPTVNACLVLLIEHPATKALEQSQKKTCVYCGKPLTGRQQKFCSDSCKTQNQRKTSPSYAQSQKDSAKKYRSNNGAALYEKQKAWRVDNPTTPEQQAGYDKTYYEKHKPRLQQESRDRMSKKRKDDPVFAESQRATNRTCFNRRMANDPIFRLLKNMRRRLGHAVKAAGAKKSCGTMELCGCDGKFLAKHLECLFQPGMTWENYGKWHVDHIRPCSAFDLSIPEQQKECFHYTNLQPLWASDNLKKSHKWPNA